MCICWCRFCTLLFFVFYHYSINLKPLLHKIVQTNTYTRYGQMCYICEAVAFSINTSANCPSRRNSELTVTFFEPGRIRKLLCNQRGQSLWLRDGVKYFFLVQTWAVSHDWQLWGAALSGNTSSDFQFANQDFHSYSVTRWYLGGERAAVILYRIQSFLKGDLLWCYV